MSEMTIYKLARELNMTPSMVSRAFNPNARVSEEKRRLILETAAKYHFSPNKHASRLSQRPIHIGVMLSTRSEVNTEKMLAGIREAHAELRDYKITYEVKIFTSRDAVEEMQATLEKFCGYDGIILSGMSADRYTTLINEVYEKNPNIVQVQAVNHKAHHLLASKHDEARASGLASDFLYQCLRRSQRRNILLFTGDQQSTVHRDATIAFRACCERLGLHLLDVVDMQDSESYFEEILPDVLDKYEEELDGIYITSGLSLPLCREIEKRELVLPFVAFDTHDDIREYMQRGIISAAISQGVKQQMKSAFEALVSYLVSGEKSPETIYTEVQLKLCTNV